MSKKILHYSKIIVPFFVICLVLYFPIIINPKIILERGNDLQEQFWPVFYFIRSTFLKTGQVPLWNSLFFSGMPLLPDPQFSLFYPANWLFIVFPTNHAFLFYIILHLFVGATFLSLFSSKILNFSKVSILFLIVSYLSSPLLFGYLEAGHYGLIASYGILPIVIFSVSKIMTKPNPKNILLLSLSLSALFFTHSIIFLASLVILPIAFLFLTLLRKFSLKRSFVHVSLSLVVCFCLIAVTLLPQIEWAPQTTRNLLLQFPDVYPKWTSFREYFKNLLPFFYNRQQIQSIPTDKWIAVGATTLLLVFVGFKKLKLVPKLTLIFFLLFLLFLGLNNINPVYELLLKQDWYLLMRVTTRPWIFISFSLTVLSGIGFEHLYKKNRHGFIVTVLFLSLLTIENLYLGWTYLNKKSTPPKKVPEKIIELIKHDKDIYRVFCTTKCISQQVAAMNNLQLVDGYNTLQQLNYFSQTWQLMGGYWNYYSLSLPPYGTYEKNQLQPGAKSLGEYNTKYIISPHPLTDSGFEKLDQIETYAVYKNKFYQPRAEVPITLYSPNFIRLDISNFSNDHLTLSEVFSPGWKAYLDGKEEVLVQESPIHLRSVDLPKGGTFLDFRYRPDSYVRGATITLITVITLLLFFLKNHLQTPTTTKLVKYLKKRVLS